MSSLVRPQTSQTRRLREDGSLQPTPIPADLHPTSVVAVIATVISALRIEAANRPNLTLDFDVGEEVPRIGRTNGAVIFRVVEELLSAVIQMTSDGLLLLSLTFAADHFVINLIAPTTTEPDKEFQRLQFDVRLAHAKTLAEQIGGTIELPRIDSTIRFSFPGSLTTRAIDQSTAFADNDD